MKFLAALTPIILLASMAPQSVGGQSDEINCRNFCTKSAYDSALGSNKAPCEQSCTGCNAECNCITNPQCSVACTNCAKNCRSFVAGSAEQQNCLNQCQECVRDCNSVPPEKLGACDEKCNVRCPAACSAPAYAANGNAGICMTVCTEATEKCGGDTTCMNTVDSCTTSCGSYPAENQTICQGYCANNCAVQTCHRAKTEDQAACYQACENCVNVKCADDKSNQCVESCTQAVAHVYEEAPPPPPCPNRCGLCGRQCQCLPNNATCCTDACAACPNQCESMSIPADQEPCQQDCFNCVATCGQNQNCYTACELCPVGGYCPFFEAVYQRSCVSQCEGCIAGGNANSVNANGCLSCTFYCGAPFFHSDIQPYCNSICVDVVHKCSGNPDCTANEINCVIACNQKAQNVQKACLDGCRRPVCQNNGFASILLQTMHKSKISPN